VPRRVHGELVVFGDGDFVVVVGCVCAFFLVVVVVAVGSKNMYRWWWEEGSLYSSCPCGNGCGWSGEEEKGEGKEAKEA
jgi:hypothetical protein